MWSAARGMGGGNGEVERRVRAIPIGSGRRHLNELLTAHDPPSQPLPEPDVPESHRAFATLDQS